MSRPPRDTLEFTAALLLGTALGAGLAHVALRQRRAGGAESRSSNLLETFVAGAQDEARSILQEGLGTGNGSSHGEPR